MRLYQHAYALSRGTTFNNLANDARNHNRNLGITTSDFIHGQRLYPQSDLKIGILGEGGPVGCGPISAYNALLSLSRNGVSVSPNIVDIIHELHTLGGFNLLGEAGTNPHALHTVIRNMGVNANIFYLPTSFDNAIINSRASTAILLYTDLNDVWHYTMVWHGDGYGYDQLSNNTIQRRGFWMYNEFGRDPLPRGYNSINTWREREPYTVLAIITFP
jgi:hypothetical protein